MIRKPVVSGQFYPHQKRELERIIEGFKPKEPSKISAKGIILPHAGYIYSGRVAVATVSRVIPKKRLIILGPNHTGLGADFSLWSEGAWEIPSGQIGIDGDLAKRILNSSQIIKEDYLAHGQEHSIEVELPIIHHFFGEFTFVPLTCKSASLETYRKVAEEIFKALWDIKEDIFFVASTDLTHYEPDQVARRKDRAVMEAVINLDEQDLIKKVDKLSISMCGVAPVAIFISCLKKLGARKSQVALYQTSGDSSGDYSSVVGYVGMIVK